MIRKNKHAHGPMTTRGSEYQRPRAKKVRDRIRRWDKRARKQSGVE